MISQRLTSRRLNAWIAIIAIFFGVFAPSVSQTLLKDASQDGHYVTVCTSTGVQYLKLDLNHSEDKTNGVQQLQPECAWCFTASHAVGMPEIEYQSHLTSSGNPICQRFVNTTPGSNLPWSPSLARAPPALN